jgi:flagellar biosynthesis anti-sigma factor FlgM
MSEVPPVGQVTNTTLGQPPRHPTVEPQAGATSTREQDQVELSAAARARDQLAQLPEVREDLVQRVKVQIEEGTYESDKKVDQLLDELVEDL